MRTLAAVALLVALAACGACASGGSANGSGGGDGRRGSADGGASRSTSPTSAGDGTGPGIGIVFETVAKGAQGPTTAAQVVARSQAELEQVWRSSGGGQPPSVGGIDFDTQMVVAVFSGQRPTAGYGVEVTAVSAVHEIQYTTTNPAPGCVTAQVLTAPFHLVAIPRTDEEVTFIERTEINPC